MVRPCASSALARASTSKADSVPSRSIRVDRRIAIGSSAVGTPDGLARLMTYIGPSIQPNTG